ncbi:hypothetical protein LRAMOSA11159 [Lichtheimia ramosa]|uniref:CCHC-type domain-containing protein n=1 Tax=Lichtheimia ramosa TaxID=688394 RepID=A0A077WUG9_9FUNG|nr:hypothetical protein LRAMOSA11159 [Lichtheimia ramosa]
MFDDEDEQELELLRQYEEQEGDLQHQSSDNELDSDLEDTLMSMVQYGSNQPTTKPKESFQRDKEQDTGSEDDISVSTTSGSQVDKVDDDSSSTSSNEELHVSPSAVQSSEPRVTRVIDLEDTPRYMDEEEEDEEERQLNDELQDLIQSQIERRQSAKRSFKPRRIQLCFTCLRPGHDQKNCNVCPDCGLEKHARHCPGLRYCLRCKRRGHEAAECVHRYEYGSCKRCGLSYHNTVHCPSIVHKYKGQSTPVAHVTPYCYFCGRSQHYGDECPRRGHNLQDMISPFSDKNATLGTRFEMQHNMKASASAFAESRHKRWRDSSSSEGSQQRESSKRRKQHNKPSLDDFFERNGSYTRERFNRTQRQSPPHHTQLQRGHGNNNWNNIPRPTRSGTVNINDRSSMDFPRNGVAGGLPKPSSSGVIDIPRWNHQQQQRGPRFRGGYSSSR